MLWAKLPGYNPRGQRVGQILTPGRPEPDDRTR